MSSPRIVGSGERALIAALTALADPGGPGVRLRFGKVTQATPLRVSLGGSDPVPAAALSTYTPAEDDVIALLQQGKQFLAIGTVVPPA